MDADFWYRSWESGRQGFHQTEVNPLLQRYWPDLNVAQGGHVFVPLCGKSLDMLWLWQQGYKVLGVELSPLAIDQFFGENGLTASRTAAGPFTQYTSDGLTILRGNFFDLVPTHTAECIAAYDRAALVALPVDFRPRYAAHMAALLRPQAQLLLIAFDYPQHEMSGPPFSVPDEEVIALYEPNFDIVRVRNKDIFQQVRFPVSRFVQSVYLMRRKP